MMHANSSQECGSSKPDLFGNEQVDLGFLPALDVCWANIGAMGSLVVAILAYIRAFFVPRHRLALETTAPGL